MTDHSSGDNKKNVFITIVVGIAVLGFLVWWMNQAQAPQGVGVSPTFTPDAEAAAINKDASGVDVGDLNAEFDVIDKDLQEL